MKKICGFRPTGRLHLGHYFSVVLPARAGDVDVLVADLHAPELVGHDKVTAMANGVATLVRLGVPRERISCQANGFNTRLFARLLALAPMGQLERMTQYKCAKDRDRTAHLLTYPVMMAVDIDGYDEVLVGEDQGQHVEFARDLLVKAGRTRIPKAKVVGGRIRDLRNPAKKMSKSSPEGCLFLDDSAADIRRKIKRATTTTDGLENLEFLYREFVGGEVPQLASDLKTELADAIIRTLEAK